LLELLKIPSISAQDQHRPDVAAAAEWIADELRRIGMAEVALHETRGHPIVTAYWSGAGPSVPTVLVYCHYDVQPVDPLHEWRHPPFQPSVDAGRVVARGASDDKGQLHIHLKAAEAYLSTSGALPVNVRFLFEGEEEIGSPNMETFLAEHRDELAADVAVVSDSKMLAEDVPTLGHGIRGIAYFEVRLRGPARDLHSGGYGGGVANPTNVLVEILASLHDENGRVTIPGFYDRVRELTPHERGLLDSLPFNEREWLAAIGVREPSGERGFGTLERLWVRPTLDINGIWGGYAGEGSKTIIPAEAGAKFSCRLVPEQDYREIQQLVIEHVRRIAPGSVDVDVDVLWGAAPVVTPLEHPAVLAAARAIEAAYGVAPLFQREGGSIPPVASFSEILGLRTVLLGFGLTHANTHGPNEWFSLRQYQRAVETLIYFWSEMSGLEPASLRSFPG
jgi:acetylornithine deacetylase/succinyl-diaminopimelate desuccinylase-like protein